MNSILTINPEAPEYSVKLTLKPKKEDMTIKNIYEKPLVTGSVLLVLWALMIGAGVFMGTITI